MLNRTLIFVFLTLYIYPIMTLAQVETSWITLTKESNKHFGNADYEKALASSLTALNVAEDEKNDFLKMQSMVQISWDYRALKQLTDAEQFLQNAIKLESNLYPANHHIRIRNSVMLAELKMLQKRPNEAKLILERAISRLEQKYRKDHDDLVAPLTLLSTISIEQADISNASNLIERAMRIHKKTNKPLGRFTNELFNNFAQIHKSDAVF